MNDLIETEDKEEDNLKPWLGHVLTRIPNYPVDPVDGLLHWNCPSRTNPLKPHIASHQCDAIINQAGTLRETVVGRNLRLHSIG